MRKTQSSESKFRKTTTSTMRSSQNIAAIDPQMMTLKSINDQEGREELLKQLDVAVDWDHYLQVTGNILDDVQKCISAADL